MSNRRVFDTIWFATAVALLIMAFVAIVYRKNGCAAFLSALSVGSLVIIIATTPEPEPAAPCPSPNPTPPQPSPPPSPALSRGQRFVPQQPTPPARKVVTTTAKRQAAPQLRKVTTAPSFKEVAKDKLLFPIADRGENTPSMPTSDRGELMHTRSGAVRAAFCGAPQGFATAQDVIEAPEEAVEQYIPVVPQDRGESLLNPPLSPYEFVPNLPSCGEHTPTELIRNNGLYGVKGDYNCDIMKRSAVMDAGYVEPLGAREEWIKYLGYDTPHKRDQFMIRKEKGPLLMV